MEELRNVLNAVRRGQREFGPQGADERSVRAFQSTAQALEVAEERGLLGEVYAHRNNDFSEPLIDFVAVIEGLTPDGDVFLRRSLS